MKANDTFNWKDTHEQAALKKITAKAFKRYKSPCGLKVPEPQYIRVGKFGGLPFNSLTSDLFLGCLPASQICYGNCFAARAAFESGFDFSKRVENILDPDILKNDLSELPTSQGYVRNGWNSDPSWDWEKALRLAEIVCESGKHMVFITKCFKKLDTSILTEFKHLNVELRVSLSAFDTASQLKFRYKTIDDYFQHGGIVVPIILTTKFKSAELNEKQDTIVNHMSIKDLPAAENSLRFDTASPVLEAIDIDQCGRTLERGDFWAGRLYEDSLVIPTLTSVSSTYSGLQDQKLSNNTHNFIKSLWYGEPVPTHNEVHSDQTVYTKPTKCGVAINWKTIDEQVPENIHVNYTESKL